MHIHIKMKQKMELKKQTNKNGQRNPLFHRISCEMEWEWCVRVEAGSVNLDHGVTLTACAAGEKASTWSTVANGVRPGDGAASTSICETPSLNFRARASACTTCSCSSICFISCRWSVCSTGRPRVK